MKKISNIFIALVVILCSVMCAVVGYNYASMQWGIKYAGYSAPASVRSEERRVGKECL